MGRAHCSSMEVLTLLRRFAIAFLVVRIVVFLLEAVVLFIEKHPRRDLLPNLGCGALVLVLGHVVTGAVAFGGVLFFAGLAPVRLATTWWTFALTLLAADLCFYVFHFASHHMGVFWADHSVHHSSRELDLSTNFRLSPIVALYAWVPSIPLLLLGLNPYLIVVCLALANDFPFFLHTTRINKLPRPIEFIFNTPSHHRVHHGQEPRYRNKNFGGILIIWDRMFGTYAEEDKCCDFGSDAPVDAKNPFVVVTRGWRDLHVSLRQESSWRGRLSLLVKTRSAVP